MVLCIFILITTPRRIRPLILTAPVKGHFLSTYLPSLASRGVLKPRPTSLTYLNGRLDLTPGFLLRKATGCFWKARSVYKGVKRQQLAYWKQVVDIGTYLNISHCSRECDSRRRGPSDCRERKRMNGSKRDRLLTSSLLLGDCGLLAPIAGAPHSREMGSPGGFRFLVRGSLHK